VHHIEAAARARGLDQPPQGASADDFAGARVLEGPLRQATDLVLQAEISEDVLERLA
jgi:hypothetical protein